MGRKGQQASKQTPGIINHDGTARKPMVTCHSIPARMAVIELRKATVGMNAKRREAFY